MFYRDTIVAGKTIIRSLKAVSRKKAGDEKRARKCHPTSEAVKKVNFRNAVRNLTAKLNHNFAPGDYSVTLTYAEEVSPEDAKRLLKNFLNNLTRYAKRSGKTFKWVAVTEYKHTRIHHHIVMSKIDISVIDKYWKHGYEHPTPLDDTGNYYKLAEYLLKETEKAFREADSPQKRRYTSSRNVIMPPVKREKISGREVYQEIRPPRGYKVDQDTVRRYEHAILEVECMEYILTCYDDRLKIKSWKKGKKVNPREAYKDYERQISFDDLQF